MRSLAHVALPVIPHCLAMTCLTMHCLATACLLAARISATGRGAASAVVASSAIVHKAMAAPAVAIAPARPRAHAQEDAVIKISRSVKAHRRAGIRRIVVVPVGTHRLNADTNNNLRIRRGRQCAHGSEREQSARQH